MESWWQMYGKTRGYDPLASVSDITNATVTVWAEAAGTEDKG